MRKRKVEHQILELVFRTNLQLTPGLVAYRLGLSCAEARARLSALVSEGALELASDEQGSLYYKAPFAVRPERDELTATPPKEDLLSLRWALTFLSCSVWTSMLLVWIALQLGLLGLVLSGLALLTCALALHAWGQLSMRQPPTLETPAPPGTPALDMQPAEERIGLLM